MLYVKTFYIFILCQYNNNNMSPTQLFTILLILLLRLPIFSVAILSPVSNCFKYNKVSSSEETRAFQCDFVTSIIVVISILNIIVYNLRELHEAHYTEKGKMVALSSGQLCRRFSLAEILCATHSFDDKYLIGKGGSAKVYKGVIDNGATSVAIKRLSFISKQAGGTMF